MSAKGFGALVADSRMVLEECGELFFHLAENWETTRYSEGGHVVDVGV